MHFYKHLHIFTKHLPNYSEDSSTKKFSHQSTICNDKDRKLETSKRSVQLRNISNVGERLFLWFSSGFSSLYGW